MSETSVGRSSDARDGRQETTTAAAGTPSSASPPGRKYGLHLINHPQIMMQSDPPDKGPNSGGRHLRRSTVETFLDDNSDFLEDYIQRKVNRRQLEQWLFKSNRMRSGSEQTAGSQFRDHAHLKSQHSLQAPPSPSCRQRSRSFTPLRKLSATKFEESGLATPILNRDVDGQVSFLRTQRNVEQKEYSNNHDHGREHDHSGQQQQCLISLVEDIVREKEEIGIARRLSTGIKKAIHTPVESVKVLLTKKSSAFSGVMYELDSYHVFTKHTSATADTLMTAAMTSKQVHTMERPDIAAGDENSPRIRSAITAPLVDLACGRSIGAVQLLSTSAIFGGEEEQLLKVASRVAATVFMRAKEGRRLSLEVARSEVFLELARNVFGEQSRIEPTIRTILTNFLTMIECERCQILLTSANGCSGGSGGSRQPAAADRKEMFAKVFDLQRSDLDENGRAEGVPFDSNKCPANLAVAADVARTGKKVNTPKTLGVIDSDGDSDCDDDSRSLLCMPIRDNDKILGVISLINKETSDFFSENDERFVEAFSIFCGMAIRSASDFEAAVVSKAKLQVAFETLNVQASSSEEEARCLAKASVPSAAVLNLDSFKFNYLRLCDTDIYKSVVRMFTDFGLLSRFDINYNTFCRWLLTVKKNYRNETVKYHNWYHAFNVCQTMYCMLKNTGWNENFGQVECLGLLIACLGHDLDHRGTTNSFQIKAKNSLATLYSNSTMERHHLNQCLLLLNIPGNRILENMSEADYKSVISVIERSILATDLAHHFKISSKIRALAQSGPSAANLVSADSDDRRVLQASLMTGCDLAAVTKPWSVHKEVSQLVAEEFWEQGDIEREQFHEEPPPMMDRESSLALAQIDFIDHVAKDVYSNLAAFSQEMRPMYVTCLENKERWERVERGEDVEDDEDEGSEDERPRSREAAARNL